jgi:hypothetical protein
MAKREKTKEQIMIYKAYTCILYSRYMINGINKIFNKQCQCCNTDFWASDNLDV